MGRKKTHEEYVQQVFNINKNIEVVGRYINNATSIEHRCKIDGHIWSARPNNILNGKGCPVCKNKKLHNDRVKTHEAYVKELKTVNPFIVVLGEYFNTMTAILHKCLIDGCEWQASPNAILSGHGCPMCSRNKKRTHQDYVDALRQVNQDIEVIGEYINSQTAILHKCRKCDTVWNAIPNGLLQGHGCPVCSGSKGEKIIKQYLNEHDLIFIPQYTFSDCKSIYVLPFDFYLPEYNVCIEYDGKQHFEPNEFFGGRTAFEETVRRDKIKTDYCLANNISLLRIRYDEDIIEVLNSFLDNTKLLNEVV